MKRFLSSMTWSALLGIGAIALFLLLTRGYEVSTQDALQVTLTAVLVGVTGFYAWSTERIAKETEKQAKATLTLAREAEQARFDSQKPVIFVQLNGRQDDTADLQCPLEFNCLLANIGVGLAVNPELTVDYPGYEFRSNTIISLKVGDRATFGVKKVKRTEAALDVPGQATIAVSYRDVYERRIQSRLRISKNPAGDWMQGDFQIVLPEQPTFHK